MELDMTKGSPSKLIIRFIIPVILGNIFQLFYSMADTVIVGRCVGLDALAAVGATGSVTFLILGFTQGLTAGFTVIISQRFGGNDNEGMKKSIGSAAILSAGAAAVMTIISLTCMDPLLRVMNTPENIIDMSRDYITIICMGIGCNILYNVMAGILRAIGNSVVPLVLLIISSAINIALDYILVAFAGMGVEGAAVATVISQGLSGIFCVIYIIKAVPVLHVGKSDFRLKADIVKSQLKVGIPMALMISITAVGTILVQSSLNLLGSVAVGAYSVCGKVDQVVTQPLAAMGLTMATYCAQNKGNKDIVRVRQGVKAANIMSVVYSVVVYAGLLVLFPYIIPLFVTENIEVVSEYAQIYVLVTGAFFYPLAMIYIFRNALQGCGCGITPMLGGVAELLSRCVLAVVAARMLSFTGICLANSFAWLTAGVFLWIAYAVIVRRMLRAAQKEAPPQTSM